MSYMLVLKGSSRLGGSTFSHHVTPFLLLLLPALFKRGGEGDWVPDLFVFTPTLQKEE